MTKGRKTTIKERLEIVRYRKEHNNEYKLVAKQCDVSYAQVYQWVQKYEGQGKIGFQDKRGKHKVDHDLTEIKNYNKKIKY